MDRRSFEDGLVRASKAGNSLTEIMNATYIDIPHDHNTRKYQAQGLIPTKTTRTAAYATTAARSVSIFAVQNVAIAKAKKKKIRSKK